MTVIDNPFDDFYPKAWGICRRLEDVYIEGVVVYEDLLTGVRRAVVEDQVEPVPNLKPYGVSEWIRERNVRD